MLLEKGIRRQEEMNNRSRALIKASSLPPRLEVMRRTLAGEPPLQVAGADAAPAQVLRAGTPVPAHQRAKVPPPGSVPVQPMVNRAVRGESAGPIRASGGVIGHAAENLARDVATDRAAGGGKPGGGAYAWGGSSLYGSAYALSHFDKHTVPPRPHMEGGDGEADGVRSRKQYPTTEVPDFAKLHEREKRRLEKRKYMNRYVTQPKPPNFTAPPRSRSQHAPPSQSTAEDWRRGRGASGAHLGAPRAGSARGVRVRDFPRPTLERPPMSVPPRTTAKVIQAQQLVAAHLRQRREVEDAKKAEEVAREYQNPETVRRVRRAAQKISADDFNEEVERKVQERQRDSAQKTQGWRKKVETFKERAERRPLLMERTESSLRARQRALYKVREKLTNVKDANNLFDDDELDILENAPRARGGRKGATGSGDDD